MRSDEEVLEYAGAFLQLYREEVFHLERTCHWLERVAGAERNNSRRIIA